MGILLVAVALALLVIYAGIKLLIQEKKEALGMLYKCAAWGFIIAGKLLIVVIVIAGIVVCLRHGWIMRNKGKMKHDDMYEQMDHHGMHQKMMMMHHGGMEGMHGGGMDDMNCCSMMGEHCSMMGKHGGMGGACSMGSAGGGDCCEGNMMNCGMNKADSLKRKK